MLYQEDDPELNDEWLTDDLWPLAMYYDVWVYNRIPDMQSGLSAIEI